MERFKKIAIAQRAAIVGECATKRAFDASFDLCSAEAVRRRRKCAEIKLRGIAAPLSEMNRQNHASNALVGQVDEEHLIEPSFPEKFRRKRGNVVGCCNEERGRATLLHPRQQRAEHAA